MVETAREARPPEVQATAPKIRSRSPQREAWRRFCRHRLALGSLIVFAVVVFVAVFPHLVASASPNAMVNAPLQPPSSAHLMGTDSLGRDIWARVAQGARISLIVGLGSQTIALAIGLTVGTVAGFGSRFLDSLLMRLTDIMLALPALLFALLFITLLGNGVTVLVAAIGFSTWPVIARLARSQVLQIKQLEYVEAAYSLGASSLRVLTREVLPNTLGPVIVQVTFGISQAIFMEAFLSFLGLGVQPPTPSWGQLLTEGFQYIQVAPHLIIFSTGAITLTLLALNAIGDGLRDALDPTNT